MDAGKKEEEVTVGPISIHAAWFIFKPIQRLMMMLSA